MSPRTLVAGEGGSVLVVGATSTDIDTQALACEGLGAPARTPSGVPVFATDALPDALDVDHVVLTPCEVHTKEVVTAWAAARALPISERDPESLAAPDGVRVVAVSAVSTGSGKTALVRRIARGFLRSGIGVAVVRHPIANLLLWDRFTTTVARAPAELLGGRPLEEREELAPVVGTGVTVATGLDPAGLVRAAAREAGAGGVIVWDGGGAAAPWLNADVHIVVIDLLRPPPPDAAARTRAAHAVVLAKADSAAPERTREIEASVRNWNPDAAVILADLSVGVAPGAELADRRVVCVEDWPSLVLGGLSAGAAAVAARRFRCGVVDPRPFAVGAIRHVLGRHPHIGAVVPSLGRTPAEIDDLAASVRATPGDAVLWASNADPAGVIPEEGRPIVRAFGELTEVAGSSVHEVLSSLLPGHGDR